MVGLTSAQESRNDVLRCGFDVCMYCVRVLFMLQHRGMLSVVVLVTIFLGLVGALALSDQCRRRRRGHRDPHTDLTRLTAWLRERERDLPTVAMVIGVLNRVAKREIQSEVRPTGSLLYY